MKLTLLRLALAGIPLAGAATPATSQQVVFRGATDVVSIPAAVRFRNRPVTGLLAGQFELWDNGVLQAAELGDGAAVPLDVTVVVDMSSHGQIPFGEKFDADLRTIAAALRPTDRLRVIVFDTGVRELLRSTPVAEIGPRPPTILPYFDIRSSLDIRHHPKLRYPALSDALLFALSRRSELDRRHLVVTLAWGHDNGSILYLHVPLGLIASRSDAQLHIALRDPNDLLSGPTSVVMQYNRLNFRAAADLSGGTIWNAAHGAEVFAKMFDETRRSYVLRYTATGVEPVGWHEVTVRVPSHPEYEIRARKGYLWR